MAENVEIGSLPPGWDRKYDARTGRYYFVNYFNKTTTWEDPRSRYRQLAQAAPVQTFENIPMQDLTNIRPSPVPGRAYAGAHGTPYSSPARSIIDTTSLIPDVEQSVAKISAMFPTVSETHIKTLLMKYLKSVFPKVEETLLLDILSNSDNNVQKATEKLISMGFEKRDTPPPRLTLRKKEEQINIIEPAPTTQAPPPPLRMKSTEEKQKMKTKLQELHPNVPDRIITIALDSVDYDEERASQILNLMVQEEQKSKPSHRQESPKLHEAEQGLISQPDTLVQQETAITTHSRDSAVTSTIDTVSIPKTPVKNIPDDKHEKIQPKRPKAKKDIPKMSRGTSTTEDKEYKSSYTMKVSGPNRNLPKGPNDDLLLTDYMTWNGPNPDLLANNMKKSLAKGPNKSLLQERTYIPKGPNNDLRKGPKKGLAKGSIYSHLSVCGNDESRCK